MCGIAGGLGKIPHKNESLNIIEAMMTKLQHRGPDGHGSFYDDHVVFGHRRLAIIDIAGGAQPMLSEDQRYIIIFNGEIYNYLELKKELEEQGVAFRSNSDTEVLLNLLIHKGIQAFEHLQGMFAFAFFDRKNKEWILARDHFGIKPLYYTILEDSVWFASEIKSLLTHPQITAKPNWKGIEQYLTFQFCMGDLTMFDNIFKLEPGCYIHGRQGKIVEKKCYWDPAFIVDENHTENYFVEQLHELLNNSVNIQLRSDVEVGAYLSGGLDSSIISILASENLKKSIKVFHGSFGSDKKYNESEYARLAADFVKNDFYECQPTAEQFVEDMPNLIYAMDEPAGGPGLFPQFRVSKMASQHVKVVLGGQGADEIFAGYARYLIGYFEQALKGAIFENQEEGKHVVTLTSIVPHLPLLQHYKPLMQNFWKEGMFEDMDVRYFRLIDRSPDILELLSNDMQNQFNRNRIFEQFKKIFNHPDTKSYINKMTNFDFRTLLPSLLQVEDRASMAASIEARVPYLDKRILELVASMPPAVKFKGGKTKAILKKAFKNHLPAKILNRKDKMGFPVPLVDWLKKDPVRSFVSDVLLSNKSRDRGIFNPNSLQHLIQNENLFGRQLWGVLCLELWFQTFIDSK